MSGIGKIKTNLDMNIDALNKLNNASMGPISNEYYEKTQGLKKVLQNSINTETVDILADTLNVPKEVALSAVSLNLSELDALTVSYQNAKRKEIDEYNKMLELVKVDLEFLEDNRFKLQEYEDSYLNLKNNTENRVLEIIVEYQIFCNEEKLRELGLTQSELTNMDYLELLAICKEKDTDIKVLYQGIESYEQEVLNVQVKELISMNYQEYKNKLASLKRDEALLLSAIRATEEEMKTARYRFLLNEEDYQEYTYEEVSIGTKEFANASPLEKMRASGALGYTVDMENYEKLTNLLNASESNPDLAKMYNYLYEKEGLESANTYLSSMESIINQTYGEAKAQAFLNNLKNEENPVDTINNHLKTTGKGLVSGMESFAQGLTSWFTTSDVYSVNDYETMYILEGLQSNKNYNGLLDNNFEISESIGNMIPSIVLSAAFSPMVGTVSMGVSAGGNSYHSALVEGQSTEKAVLYGVLNGASEALLEKYLGAIPGLSDVNVTSLKTFAQAMLKEGVEEGTQEYVDALMRTGIFKEEFLLEEVTKNASKSAIYGAITGGIMNTPSLAISGLNKIGNNNSNVRSIEINQQINDNIEVLNSDIYELSTDGLEGPLKDIVEDWNSMGIIDLEIGKQIENLFNKKDTLSGIHMTPNLSSANQILIEGLQLTGHSSSGGINNNIDLDLNISFTKQDDFLAIPKFFRNIKFSSFYKNYTGTNVGYAMVVQIPTNVENISSLTYQKNGITYLKPEYIKAQIEVENGNVSNSTNTILKDIDDKDKTKNKSYNNGQPIQFESIKDFSRAAFEFSEGNKDLENLLNNCFDKKIETHTCCSGHMSKSQLPYISFRYSEENSPCLNKLLLDLKNSNYHLWYTKGKDNTSSFTIEENNNYDFKTPTSLFKDVNYIINNYNENKDYSDDLPKELKILSDFMREAEKNSIIEVQDNLGRFQIHYLKQQDTFNFLIDTNNRYLKDILEKSEFIELSDELFGAYLLETTNKELAINELNKILSEIQIPSISLDLSAWIN